jgi:hypothetical protein
MLRTFPWPRRQQVIDPLDTPEFFPMRIDAQRNALLFVQMSRETLKQSAFLDKRAFLSGRRTLLANIDKLRSRHPQGQLHVILHGAFCGSTLLARYFEQLPRCLVLKEPNIIAELALANPKTAPLWDDWFDVVMAMLARSFDGCAVVTKAPDLANWMGETILDRLPGTKIIFLHSSLRTFLLQTLKNKDRRIWLREHLRNLTEGLLLVPFLPDEVQPEWSDGQYAAAMWLLNSFLCSRLLMRPDGDRVLVMNGDAMISSPQANLLAAARFFGMLKEKKNRRAAELISPITIHSKDPNLAYDESNRASDIARAHELYGNEIQEAMIWARQISADWLSRSPFPVE